MIIPCRRNIGLGIAGAKPSGAKGDGTLPGNVAMAKLDCREIPPCNSGAALRGHTEVPRKVASLVYIGDGCFPQAGFVRRDWAA